MFLALQHNQITKIEGIDHLNKLALLDISHNKIISVGDVKNLPLNIQILKLNNNPISSDKFYRKAIVLRLPVLEELDRIKVVPAERMSYQGVIKNVDVKKLLEDFEKQREEDDARDKMEVEIYREMREEKGEKVDINQKLEEFGELNEFKMLKDEVNHIMEKA